MLLIPKEYHNPKLLLLLLIAVTLNIFLTKDCQQGINKKNVVINPEVINSQCMYNLIINGIATYSRKLSAIPPHYIIVTLNKNAPLYKRIIKKYNNYISVFYNLLKQNKKKDLHTYLKTTILNKKEGGIKILIGLLLSADSKRYFWDIVEQFISKDVFNEVRKSIKLKNLLFPILASELYTQNISKRKIILYILSNIPLPTAFFCKNYQDNNLSEEEVNLCLSNINSEDIGWIKTFLFNKKIPYTTKITAINAARTRNIDNFDNIFIEYAKFDLIDKKTDPGAVELFRSILAYLGEHPTNRGLQFASEITLDRSIPFVLRHEAITSLDKMSTFSNETFFTLINALKDENNQLRAHAANFLGNLFLAAAIPYLKETAKNDPYNITRAYALEAIGKIAQRKESNFIIQFTKDNTPLLKLLAIQILLKNHYHTINLSAVIKFLSENTPILLPEDQMAKTLAFEILQEFAPPDLSYLLIEKLKNEQDINIIFLINNTLNRIFSMEYTLNNSFDENAKKNMIAFWKRIYSINKKNMSKRIALDVNGLKQVISIFNKRCYKNNICKFTLKPLFRSYTNKFYRKIKNFTSYNFTLFVEDKKVMEKHYDKKTWDFTIKFTYPQQERLNLILITRIDKRVFKQHMIDLD